MHRIRINNGLLYIPQATPPEWGGRYVTASPRADPRLSIFYAVALAAHTREQEAEHRAALKPPKVQRKTSPRSRRTSWGKIAFRQELMHAWS